MTTEEPLPPIHQLGQRADSLSAALADAGLRDGIHEIAEMALMLTQARVGVLYSRHHRVTPHIVVGASREQLERSELCDVQRLLPLDPIDEVICIGENALTREAQRAGISVDRRLARACIVAPVRVEHLPDETVFVLGRDTPFTDHEQRVISRAAHCIAVALDHAVLLRAVQHEERRFRGLIESSSEGLAVITPEGVVRYISPAVQAIEGFAPEEIVGTDPFDRVHPEDLAHVRATLAQVTQQPGKKLRFDVRHRHKNGSWVWLEVILSNLLHEPAVAGIVANYRDVTQRKRAEEAMLLSQKMDALGRLAGGIAHDFNNLLLAISGNAALALGDLDADHPARESVQQIVAVRRRATDLVAQILAYSRQQEPKRETVDLKATVAEALRLLRPTVGPQVDIRFTSAPDVPHIHADSSQIIQVIVNLVTNAAHALPNGKGTIELKLEAHRDRSGELAFAGGSGGPYAKLIVRDNGVGMKPQTIARMFDPFFTTKPAGQGTGLGLSVVHGVVTAHAGSISVESTEGEGTTIEVSLPAASAVAVPARDEECHAPAGANECVLYVDDDSAIVFLITRILERLGYRVAPYQSAKEAVEAFRAAPERYSAVITDLSMPEMSGFALATQMRSIRPDIPILLTSGYVRPSDSKAARAQGIGEIILKPDTVFELGHALDRVLRGCRRTTQNE